MLSNSRRFIRIPRLHVAANCAYHSYPDPNEVPKITETKSTFEKRIDKKSSPWIDEFRDMKKFSIETNFLGNKEVISDSKHTTPVPEVSKLENGLTVVSVATPHTSMSSFAFLVKSGSADEIQSGPGQHNTGASLLLECTAFGPVKGETSYTDNELDTVSRKLNRIGGVDMATSSRECIIYFVDVIHENAERAMKLLSSSVLMPMYNEATVYEGLSKILSRNDYMPADLISRDGINIAAYNHTPLGHKHYPQLNDLQNLTPAVIESFRSQVLYGENCVLAATGMDHQELVGIAKEAFNALPKSGTEKNPRAKSTYTGGLYTETRQLQEPFVKVTVAFEVGGYRSKNLYTMTVLEKLLGGGSSFSAGGPGKGMYTRLYQEVLCRYAWVESAQGFVSIFDDNGLFGIDASCRAENVYHLYQVIVNELLRLTVEEVTPLELSRAKNMLKSMLMMQLESRIITCEDLARQFATFGKREEPEETCRRIDEVTSQDILNLTREMFMANPSVACIGEDVSKLPSYDYLSTYTRGYRDSIWNKFGYEPENRA